MSADDEEQRAYEEMLTGDPKPYIDELLELRAWMVRLEKALAINYTNDFLRKLSYELSAYMAPADHRAPRWERVGPRG
jgi:hypothetical protein